MKAVRTISRIQLKNILFATDFSPVAAAALPFAAQLAQTYEARLFAVHAKSPENYALPTAGIGLAADAQVEELAIELRRNMYNRYPRVETDVLVVEGGVWGVVSAVADEKQADLIVVGTNGRQGIGKFILGSVAEEILRRATCPVLTVGPHCPAASKGAATFKKILYATDFGESSPAAAAYAVALAQEHEAHLTLLHVIASPRAGELVRPPELEAAALERLRTFVSDDAQLWCEPRAIVAHGDPAEEILATAEKERADLIVLGLRNTKGVGRATHLPMAVAHKVVSQATCPVLTVR